MIWVGLEGVLGFVPGVIESVISFKNGYITDESAMRVSFRFCKGSGKQRHEMIESPPRCVNKSGGF